MSMFSGGVWPFQAGPETPWVSGQNRSNLKWPGICVWVSPCLIISLHRFVVGKRKYIRVFVNPGPGESFPTVNHNDQTFFDRENRRCSDCMCELWSLVLVSALRGAVSRDRDAVSTLQLLQHVSLRGPGVRRGRHHQNSWSVLFISGFLRRSRWTVPTRTGGDLCTDWSQGCQKTKASLDLVTK